jgi:hypothetical protein
MRTIALDSQILNTLQSCARKLKFEFIDNWRPTEKAEALEKGDLIHKMFAHYYRGKMAGRTKDDVSHAVLIAAAIAEARQEAIPMSLSAATVEEDIRQFKENVLYWQNDGWNILEIEQPFSKTLFERADTPEREGIRIIYEGIIDAVVEHPSPYGKYIVDHKTASRRAEPNKLSNQFMGYCWALGMNQVIINRIGFQKTLSASERFQRLHIQYDKEIIREWVQQAVYWAHVLAGYIDQGYFPPNFTSCDKYAGCIFQQVCKSVPGVRDFKLQSFYYQGETWSPLTRDKHLKEPESDAKE